MSPAFLFPAEAAAAAAAAVAAAPGLAPDAVPPPGLEEELSPAFLFPLPA